MLCRRPRRSACPAPPSGRPLPRAFGHRSCLAPLPSLRAARRAAALSARRGLRPASLWGPLPLAVRGSRVEAVARASALVPRCGRPFAPRLRPRACPDPLAFALGGPSSAAAAWAGGGRGWPSALGAAVLPLWAFGRPPGALPRLAFPKFRGGQAGLGPLYGVGSVATQRRAGQLPSRSSSGTPPQPPSPGLSVPFLRPRAPRRKGAAQAVGHQRPPASSSPAGAVGGLWQEEYF